MCACVTLPVWLSNEDFGGAGWLKKLALLSDGCIRLQSFAGRSGVNIDDHERAHFQSVSRPMAFCHVSGTTRASSY